MVMLKRRMNTSATAADPFKDTTSIGNILLRMGAVTQAQLLVALGQKAHHDEMLLGALLKQLGLCTDEQVAKALLIQSRLRSGDRALAELDLLEARVAQFDRGEQRIAAEIERFDQGERHLRERIDQARTEQRERGEESGLWLIHLSPQEST